MADLMALPNGLLFRNGKGGIEHKLEERIKAVAKKAGVRASIPRADWCHRWRDSFATEKVRQKVHDLRDIAKMMGHSDLETIDCYAAWCEMNSEEAEMSAELSDPESASVS